LRHRNHRAAGGRGRQETAARGFGIVTFAHEVLPG
jgi:hypothetical protein